MPVPADMFEYLTSADCAFSAKEKTRAYKSLLKASVLAFDPKSGVSRFSWAFSRISVLDERAKSEAMLHSDHTIASICKAFFSYLMEAEGRGEHGRRYFRGLERCKSVAHREHAGSGARAYQREEEGSVIHRNRERLQERSREASRAAGSEGKGDLEQEDRDWNKRTEIQKLQAKLETNKSQITTLRDERDKATTQAAEWNRSELQSLPKQRK